MESVLSLPSRLERRRIAKRNFLYQTIAGILFTGLILSISLADFSHLDRRWLPVVSGIAVSMYGILAIRCTVSLVKRICWPSLSARNLVTFLPAAQNDLLINRPYLKGYFRQLLEMLISAYVWGIFLYFFQPLLTALLWLATGEWIWWFVFSTEAVYGTLNMLLNSIFFGLIILLILFSWVKWNLYHYGGLDRRKPPLPVQDEKVAEHFGVSLETIETAKMARVATINPTVHGPIFTVKLKSTVEKIERS